MATSTICFNGQLTGISRGECYCDLRFTPPSNIAGKLCYVQAKAFNFPNTWGGKSAWHSLVLYNDWPQVQCAQVDFNPALQDSGGFTADRTLNDANLLNVNPPFGYGVGTEIRGTGIPAGTTITAVSGSTITLSAAQTATTATGVSYVFFNPQDDQQKLRVPLATFNDYAQNHYKVLVNMPSGPHTIRFTVKRSDKGIIAGSVTQTSIAFFVVFEIVPADSRQPPLI